MGKNGIMIAVGCVFVAVGIWMFAYPAVVVFGVVVMVIGLVLVYFGFGKPKRTFSFKREKKSPPKK